MRNARLAKVHIARKALALEEASYRALLARITGKDSAGGCTDAELDAVLEEFKRLGWTDRRSLVGRPPSGKPHVRKIHALWGTLRPYLRDSTGAALRSFCERQTGVTEPEWLNAAQANKVTEALKSWLRREQERRRAAG